jgi:hypothetical protein
MDPLSGAANVIAVVSLTIQVCDSIKKLNDFRLQVKYAPKDLIQLSDQLTVLENILKAVSRKIQLANGLPDPKIESSHELYAPLKMCQDVESELKQVVEYLEARYLKYGAKSLRTSILTT